VRLLCHLIFGLTAGSLCAAPVSLANIKARKEAKQFPSLFQVWNGFQDTAKDSVYNQKYEKHYKAENDLFMTGPWYYGLEFDSPSLFTGEGTVLKPESIVRGLAIRDSLLQLNPNLILIGEVRYYDAQLDFLPATSPFWVKGTDGKPKQNPDCCPGYALLDWNLPAYQKQVASRAKAILASGVVDGIFLDWATDDRFDFFKAIRDSIGPDAIIYGNSNTSYREKLTPLMNGIFMEGLDSNTPLEWEAIRDVVSRSQLNLREPKLITFESWGNKKFDTSYAKELSKMRATITLMMTQSDGYSIYYPDNSDIFNDHWHPWYDFYEVNVGSPIGPGALQPDGSYRREFKNGIAIYNPPLNAKEVTVIFPGIMVRKSTGLKGTTFKIPFYDGDIFIPEAKFQTAELKRAHTIFGLPSPKQYPVALNPKELPKKFSQKILGQSIGSDIPILKVNLYSVNGNEIKLANPTVAQNLESGIYIARIATKNGTFSKKIIKR
jgi:hypothetical protein